MGWCSMANELQQVYEADGREITLNPAVITQYVLNGSNSPVLPSEMAKTIMTCAARKLDPFAGDVHILPHWDKDTGTTKLSVSPSIDFYQRRAMANPRYRGIRDGIVVVVNGEIVKKHGCAVYQELGETLIGGWAEVYVEGYEKSVYVEVSLSEYNTHKALWKYKPATMINKVAKAQALRKAFPDEFMGLLNRLSLESRSLSKTRAQGALYQRSLKRFMKTLRMRRSGLMSPLSSTKSRLARSSSDANQDRFTS